ncbi:hypothetical protein Tco_0609176 [Tanacetum coccineum]
MTKKTPNVLDSVHCKTNSQDGNAIFKGIPPRPEKSSMKTSIVISTMVEKDGQHTPLELGSVHAIAKRHARMAYSKEGKDENVPVGVLNKFRMQLPLKLYSSSIAEKHLLLEHVSEEHVLDELPVFDLPRENQEVEFDLRPSEFDNHNSLVEMGRSGLGHILLVYCHATSDEIAVVEELVHILATTALFLD